MRGTWPRSFWYSVRLIVALNSLFLAPVQVKPGCYDQFENADDVGQALGWLLATLHCFVGLQKPWQRTQSPPDSVLSPPLQHGIPHSLPAAIFCQFIGQVIY